MGGNHIVDLQKETAQEKNIPGLCREPYPMFSQDANQMMVMKVEEASDMQEEEVPVPKPWHAIKAECEVSRVSLSC
jgi:hypothetical protein